MKDDLKKKVKNIVSGIDQMLMQRHYDEADLMIEKALVQVRNDAIDECAKTLDGQETNKAQAKLIRALKT